MTGHVTSHCRPADEPSNEPQSVDDGCIDGLKGEGAPNHVYNMILAAVTAFRVQQ